MEFYEKQNQACYVHLVEHVKKKEWDDDKLVALVHMLINDV